MLSEITIRFNFAVECVTEIVRHDILQFCQVLNVYCNTAALEV